MKRVSLAVLVSLSAVASAAYAQTDKGAPQSDNDAQSGNDFRRRCT